MTDDPNYDDRLPSWSYDGNMVLFQRADVGSENWQIYKAEITLTPSPVLGNITKIPQPDSHNTDNSWYFDNEYILSSSDYSIEMPNIYLFSSINNNVFRITYSDFNEDGAPSCSPDGEWIAFKSHSGQDEDTPSEIWIIKVLEF